MKTKLYLLLSVFIYFFFSCSKPSDTTPIPPKKTIYWEGVVFGRYDWGNNNPYFSTIDTSFKTPLHETDALAKADKIDIVYIYNGAYSRPGFMDPFTLTQHWYWDDYYTPWLNSAYHTKFFMTTLNKEHFDSAKADGSKFQVYFSDTSKVYIALHSIFPNGTCIGGRAGGDDPLAIGKVYGFISNDKKGFIYITPDQSAGWPWPLINHNTKVDIVKEK